MAPADATFRTQSHVQFHFLCDRHELVWDLPVDVKHHHLANVETRCVVASEIGTQPVLGLLLTDLAHCAKLQPWAYTSCCSWVSQLCRVWKSINNICVHHPLPRRWTHLQQVASAHSLQLSTISCNSDVADKERLLNNQNTATQSLFIFSDLEQIDYGC